MEKNELASLIVITLLLTSTFAAYVPKTIASLDVYFQIEVMPKCVKNGTWTLVDVKVHNNDTSGYIYWLNVTYPNGWTFNKVILPDGWAKTGHDTNARNVTMETYGGAPGIGAGVWEVFTFNVTTPTTEEDGIWYVSCKHSEGGLQLKQEAKVYVDGTPPTISVDNPSEAQIYSGAKVWVNITVTDECNCTPTVLITPNITATFEEQTALTKQTGASAPTYEWKYYFVNKTTIPDGPLMLNVTATDGVGWKNWLARNYTIDNTAPIKRLNLYGRIPSGQWVEMELRDDTYYMRGDTDQIKINVKVDPPDNETDRISYTYSWVYINTTNVSGGWSIPWVCKNQTITVVDSTSVADINYMIINVTLTDAATPKNHTQTRKWTVIRDLEPPIFYNVTKRVLKGGFMLGDFNSSDNIAIAGYNIYINGTEQYVSNKTLYSATWTSVANVTVAGLRVNFSAFYGKLLLWMYDWGCKHVNITVTAVDVGGLESANCYTDIQHVEKGTWCPVELHNGWNLFSLPLIPYSTARADILSLVLKQGAAGVNVVYGYNNATDSWIINPATMTDGLGYWVNVKAYDVIIVEGRQLPPPPALPPTYYLTEGWVLAGFKCIQPMTVSTYLSSLEADTYFQYIYVWDAENQNWLMLDGSGTLQSGQGFWIWMYEDQYLIPPLP